MASISTSTFFGRVLTATQLRAGLWLNHFSYSSFMGWKARVSSASVQWSRYFRAGDMSYREVSHIRQEDVALDDSRER